MENLEENIRNCNHDFLFDAVAVRPEDLGDAHEIEEICCCNKCGGYIIVQKVAQGKSVWMAYPSEYPKLYE